MEALVTYRSISIHAHQQLTYFCMCCHRRRPYLKGVHIGLHESLTYSFEALSSLYRFTEQAVVCLALTRGS